MTITAQCLSVLLANEVHLKLPQLFSVKPRLELHTLIKQKDAAASDISTAPFQKKALAALAASLLI